MMSWTGESPETVKSKVLPIITVSELKLPYIGAAAIRNWTHGEPSTDSTLHAECRPCAD